MGELNGQKKGQKTQVQRTHQRRNRDAAPKRDRRSGSVGANVEPVGTLGVGSPDRIRRNRARVMLGGILAQLIESYEDQLSDARDCIAREQKKIDKLEKSLQNLRHLQALQKSENVEN